MRIKKFLVSLFQSVVFWMLAFFIYTFVKYNGLELELAVYTDDILNLPVSRFYDYSILLGFVVGIVYAIIEYLFDIYFNKRLALGLSICIRSIIYFILIVLVLSVLSVFIEEEIDIDLSNEKGWWHTDPFFWNTILYFVVSSIMFSLLKIANDKFGSGVFFNMLLGKYRKPREEERILMFVDLKDSTKIAEELRHEKYSQFIQDCFSDLNSLLGKYDANVYQYVGDEAVLEWKNKNGFRKNNCINFFFAFQDKLLKRQKHYIEKYNQFPKFKAGLHCGKLMIAEVGTIKKELAYHGDVINTASRIQGQCNPHNASLLVSEELIKKMSITSELLIDEIGSLSLKGKQKKINIFSVRKS